MTLNTAITFTTKLDGSGLDQLKRQLQSLSQQSNITKQSLGQANIDINRMAREAGNTTNGLRTHIGALKNLRDNVDINSQAYRRLGNEIKGLESKLQGLDRVSNKVNVGRQAIGAAGGALALGGGAAGAFGAAGGVLASAGPAGMLAAGVGAATVGVAASSFGAAKELNDQERKLATLTVQSSGLTNAIRLLVAEQGFLASSAESASAAYEILSSGYTKQSDVLNILKASTLGATGGFSDIKTVADATTTILNSFSLSADNANQIVDGMIQTQNDGKIVVSQYADQIAKVASVAAAAGLSVEEMNASIAAITATGVPAETAMSGLRQALINVIKPTDQARELAKKIGLEFSLAAIQTKGWAGFLKDATDKTDGSAEALSILFGDIDGFNAILKLTGPNMGRFNDFLDNQEKKLGAAAKAAKQAKDPFKQFDIAVTELNTSIGKIFLPTLTKLITQVTTFFQIISSDKNKEAVRDYGNIIRGLGIAGGGNIYSGNVPQSERIDAPVPERLKKPPQRQLRAPGAGTVNQKMPDLTNEVRQGGGGSGDEEKRRQAENRYKQIANNNQKEADARQIHALEVINFLKAESVAFEAQRTKTNELEINKLILRNQLDVVFLENEKDRINLALKYVNAKEKAKIIEDATARNLELQNVENEGLSDNQKLILDLKTKEQSINSDFLKTEKNRREEKEKYLTQLDKEIQMLGDAEQQELAIANLKLRYRRDPRALEAELQDLGIRQRYEKRASTLIEDLAKEGITGKEASQRIQNLDKELDKALQGAEAIRALKRSIDELNAADVGQGFKNGVESFLTSIGTMSQNVSQLTQNAFQGLSDGITELVTTGKMNFNDFANSIIKDMIRIATQQLILRPILQGIGGLFGGGGGSGLPGFGMDSIIPGLGLGNTPAFKFAGGGIMTAMGPMPLKRYAAGGIANSPQLAMYGEGRMPEAYVPLPDGRRIPVAMQGSGGGSTSVVVNVDATGSKVEGDSPKGDQLGRALSQAVQQELLKQKRPGGLLS